MRNDKRPSFEDIYMSLAHKMSERSTCERIMSDGSAANVGCVITSADFRYVYGVGYNGNAAGGPNGCDVTGPNAAGICGCVHAESNAVINCRAERAHDKIVFVTHLPCVSCFVPETLVVSPSSIQRAYRRRYVGDVLRIITTNGEFTTTPNHPILTSGRGWLAAEALHEGDYLFNPARSERIGAGTSHHDQGQPIEEVFETLSRSSLPVRSSGACHQFHGDGLADENVDVVTTDRTLKRHRKRDFAQFIEQPTLSTGDTSGMPLMLDRSRNSRSFDSAAATALRHRQGQVGIESHTSFMQSQGNHVAVDAVRFRDGEDRFSGDVLLGDDIGRQFNLPLSKYLSADLSLLAQESKIAHSILDGGPRNAEPRRERVERFLSEIALDKILHIERNRRTTHVYNLQTTGGWYFAGTARTVVQNCAKFLINLGGVKKVFYRKDYRIREGVEWLQRAGIEVVHFEASHDALLVRVAHEKLERDYAQATANLTSVQSRCNELLLENRKLRGVD